MFEIIKIAWTPTRNNLTNGWKENSYKNWIVNLEQEINVNKKLKN